METIQINSLADFTKYVYYKNNVAPSREVKTCKEAVDNSCGLHSARIQSPYIALLSRVVDFRLQDLNESLFIKKEFIKHRNVRTTLHLISYDMLPHFHIATLKQKTQGLNLFFKRNNIGKELIDIIVAELEKTTSDKFYFPEELENKIKETLSNIEKKSTVKQICRKIIKYLCEIGVLYYTNTSSDWLKEIRQYVVTKHFFKNYNLNNGDISYLINRYFKCFGPASLKDYSWWSGLPQSLALEVINTNDNYIELCHNGTKLYMLKDDYNKFLQTKFDSEYINLLAWEESVIKAYKETRYRFVNEKSYHKLFNIIGEARCSILYNGEIVGTWEYDKKKHKIITSLFKKSDMYLKSKLKEIVKKYELNLTTH